MSRKIARIHLTLIGAVLYIARLCSGFDRNLVRIHWPRHGFCQLRAVVWANACQELHADATFAGERRIAEVLEFGLFTS